MISYIVMAAGTSARFHSPKALALIKNEFCINLLLKTLIASPIQEIIVVLGAHHDLIHPHVFKHNLIRIVHNNDYNFGQTSSAITGLRETDLNSVIYAIHPVDCPFIKVETINQLLLNFNPAQVDVLIPSWKGKKGHPPLFNKKIKDLILKLNLTTGINTIFDRTDCRIEEKETSDKGVIQSFNTIEELNQILTDRQDKII